MPELLKINPQTGQWSLEKSKPMDPKELAEHKARRDAYLREKHGIAPKEEHEKQLEAHRGRDVPKLTKPDYSSNADKKYKEGFHSATREVSPGKFVHQGMPKKPPADVVPPISKRPEFHGGGFDRSPVRMGAAVRKK